MRVTGRTEDPPPRETHARSGTSGRAERRILPLSSLKSKGVPRGTDPRNQVPRGQTEVTDPREQKDIPQTHERKGLTIVPLRDHGQG